MTNSQQHGSNLDVWWLVESDIDEAAAIDARCHGQDYCWTSEDLRSERKSTSRTVISTRDYGGDLCSWAMYDRLGSALEIVRASYLTIGSAYRLYQYVTARLSVQDTQRFEVFELVPERLLETRCDLLGELGWIASRTFTADESPHHWPEPEPGVEMIFRKGW